MIGSAVCPQCGSQMYKSLGERNICPKCGYGASTPLRQFRDGSGARNALEESDWLDRIFSWLFPTKRQKDAEPLPRRELGEARQAFEWKEFDHCIIATKPFLNSADVDLQREANTLAGLSHLSKKDFALSLPFLEKAAQIRGYALDWQYVAVAATLTRDLEKGRVALKQALTCCKEGKNEKTSEYYVRLDYTSALVDVGEFLLALRQINLLSEVYESLGITDDTFLWLRGVPRVEDVASLAVRIFRGMGDIPNGKIWLGSLAKSVDEDGKEVLERYLHELENGN